MLLSLRIENFAIVKQLELDFSNGMTAFTGETGAGKSIMFDALMLALGARADSSVIRPGEEKCDISALFFCDQGEEPLKWLADHDLLIEDGNIWLRRVLYSEGRSKSYINGQPFPLQKVKELSELLVHIHGQHQQQSLMDPYTHRQQLDHYAGHQELLQTVQRLYKEWQKINQEVEAIGEQHLKASQLELLQYQIEELASLDIIDDEVPQLHEEHRLLHHAKDYLLDTETLSQLLNGDDTPSICKNLNQALQILQNLPKQRPEIGNCLELINNALIHCEEATNEIKRFAGAIQLDPERLHHIENRLSQLHQIARKYHSDIKDLPNILIKLEQELASLKGRQDKLTQLKETQQRLLEEYMAAATLLSQSRTVCAEKLSQDITQYMQQLGMPKGQLTLELTALQKMQMHGLDKVEYKICTNPGMTPDSLNKIASGGELSRVSLAIQVVTAKRSATPTLLFDEVDVGIGGATAALVGNLLRQLGARLQVFCVTHQPQVASCAHHHFSVKKQVDQQHTYTSVHALTESERINEIARMLGGLTITAQSLSHAKELITSIDQA